MAVKKGLGKGLGALIIDEPPYEAQGGVLEVDINEVEPNREQPRKRFVDSEIEELAESIVQFGLLQPIVVRREDGYYSIIAGERRWRAARIVKLKTVPVIIKEFDGAEALEAALIENIQRADLNPVEEANCYARLMEDYGITQESLSKRVGKSRTHISSAVRLLSLDKRVLEFVSSGRLTLGHAKALMSIDDGDAQFQLAERVIEEALSVRQAEQLSEEYKKPKPEKPTKEKEPHIYKHVEDELTGVLKTRVTIKGAERGKIEISYFSPEDLDRLLMLIKR